MFMWTHPQSLDHNPQTSSNIGEEEEEEEEEEREKGGKGAKQQYIGMSTY